MAKLTNKQKQALNDILGKLLKCEAFIKSDRVAVSVNYSTGKTEINKEVGSELNYLYSASSHLKNFIEYPH